MPSISFLDSEVSKLSKAFTLTLVGKLSFGIPKLFESTKILKDLNLKTYFTVSSIIKCYATIKLFSEEDFNFLWVLENPNVGAFRLGFLKFSYLGVF